jgi:RHS repeat-associated protein
MRCIDLCDDEKVVEYGVTREFYYLDGNVIVVKKDGVFTPYLAFTDNLGSILSLMDENGDAVFEAEYDAWGKPTVSLNEIGFHRGYTGHEMLPEFDLINMNGRLYDPMIGLFLSPDPYVQMPEFSQNYNRYSYCVNNPLKYRDENGEFFIGFLSGFFRGVFQGQNPFIAGWNAGVNELTEVSHTLRSS